MIYMLAANLKPLNRERWKRALPLENHSFSSTTDCSEINSWDIMKDQANYRHAVLLQQNRLLSQCLFLLNTFIVFFPESCQTTLVTSSIDNQSSQYEATKKGTKVNSVANITLRPTINNCVAECTKPCIDNCFDYLGLISLEGGGIHIIQGVPSFRLYRFSTRVCFS